MEVINLLQWPAMAVTVIAAWLTAAQTKRRRKHGFWWFIASNILWVIWAVPAEAYALVCLQIALAGLNIRGAFKNESA